MQAVALLTVLQDLEIAGMYLSPNETGNTAWKACHALLSFRVSCGVRHAYLEPELHLDHRSLEFTAH